MSWILKTKVLYPFLKNISVPYICLCSVFCRPIFFCPSFLFDTNLVQYILAKYPPAAPSSPLLSAYYLSHESAFWTKQSWLEHQTICKMENKGEETKYITIFFLFLALMRLKQMAKFYGAIVPFTCFHSQRFVNYDS